MVRSRNHPLASNHGYIYEHRQVMEESLGRYLSAKERIHHVNMIKNDNRIENLALCANHSIHFLIHGSLNTCVHKLLERGHLKFDSIAQRYYVP